MASLIKRALKGSTYLLNENLVTWYTAHFYPFPYPSLASLWIFNGPKVVNQTLCHGQSWLFDEFVLQTFCSQFHPNFTCVFVSFWLTSLPPLRCSILFFYSGFRFFFWYKHATLSCLRPPQIKNIQIEFYYHHPPSSPTWCIWNQWNETLTVGTVTER